MKLELSNNETPLIIALLQSLAKESVLYATWMD